MEHKVLMLVDALDMVNGVSMTARQLAMNWYSPDWELTVYGTGATPEDHVYDNAHLCVATTPVTMPLLIYRDIVLSFPVVKTWREMHKHQQGIIHAATPGILGLRGLWYANRHSIPYVTTHHTRMTMYARLYVNDRLADQADRIAENVMRLQYSRSMATIVHSPGAGEEARQMGAKNIIYAPMGIPVPYTDINELRAKRVEARASVKAELGLDEGNPILLYVGRLAVEKSVDILCQAANELKLPFIFVGDGPMRHLVARNANTISVGTRRGNDLEKMYLAADLFISASISETLGRIFFEALAYGTPILLPDSGQQDSLLPNDNPAIVKFRRNDTYVGLEELVREVRAFLEKPGEERDCLTQPALEFAKRYSWENVMPAHIAPYEQVAERSGYLEHVS